MTPPKNTLIMQKSIKLLALLTILCFSLNSYAQSLGPKIGINIASWGGDDSLTDDLNSVVGVQLGAAFELPVSDRVSILPEVLYFQKGAGEEFSFAGSTSETDVFLNYLEIPILAKVYFNDGPTKIYGTAGPSIGFGLNGKVIDETAGNRTEMDLDFKNDEIATVDFSLSVGAGTQFSIGPGNLFFDIRYLLGLNTADDTNPKSQRDDIFNRGFGISTGVLFPLGGQ